MSHLVSFSEYVRAVRGGFVGLGIGDALGVPVEIYTHEEIMKVTGGRGVTDYLDPKLTRVKDTQGLPKGSTSDDTQLARVTARSLIFSRGFNILGQGLGLVDEYECTRFGWGGTTKAAAVDIKAWRDSNGTNGRHPELPAPPPTKDRPSAGSGPAMKVFPLAAYDLIGRDSDDAERLFVKNAMDLGLMTHGDVRACMASVALGHAIGEFAGLPAPSKTGDAPQNLHPSFAKRAAAKILLATKRAEATYRYFRPEQVPPFSSYLEKAFSLLDDPVALRIEVNISFLAVHSVPFAIATALRHPDNFRAAMCEGVSAGHDTDTIGAMIGATVGTRVGLEGIPAEWQSGLLEFDDIVAEADQLCCVAYGLNPDDAKRVLPSWVREKAH